MVATTEDAAQALERLEEAEHIYRTETQFRRFADARHRGHCDASDPLHCIEEDHFLVRMLALWDDDPMDS